jgi:hypothetical protein
MMESIDHFSNQWWVRERDYDKKLEVVAGKQLFLPTISRLHPYEGKGEFDDFLHITYKEI